MKNIVQNGKARLKATAATATVAGSMLLMAGSPALAAACVTQKENISLQTRVLQTELMVAALSCGEAARYNAFVKAYRPQLMESHSDISDYFKRTSTGNAKKDLNAFMTQLANDASLRSSKDKAAYCASAKKIFSQTLKPGGVNMARYVRKIDSTENHGMNTCQREAKAPVPRDKPGRSRFSLFKKKSD